MPKTKIEIIYSDDNIIVINKPTGTSVTADRSGRAQLSDLLARQLGSETADKLRLVHRLDKHTSGVMLLALNIEAQSKFSSYFAKRLVKKTYLAIVTGHAGRPQGSIKTGITPDGKKLGKMRVGGRKGKEAITNWRLLADFGTVALLAVQPVTGRTHQIRVHLPHAGMPLVIDPLYGSDRPLCLSDFKADFRLGKKRTENPLIERLTLHAYQIEFQRAQPGLPDYFIAGLDKKFKAAVKMLAKHNPNRFDAFTNREDYDKIINAQRIG